MSRLLLTLLALLSANVYSAPNIVVSIAPIHSIVSNITQSVTEPKLLLKGNQSAHHAHLVPSQLSMIEQADLVVIMHPNFEVGLSKSLSQLNTKTVLLVNDGINNHHSWVNIQKMKDFSKKITDKLSLIDPDNKTIYLANYAKLQQKLTQLKIDITQVMKNNKHPIASYSNALEHFIKENRLNQKTLITTKHEERLSIYKIINAKKSMLSNSTKCLISTTSVPIKHINILTEGLEIDVVRINIMGDEFATGNNQYFQLMNNITKKVDQCLQ